MGFRAHVTVGIVVVRLAPIFRVHSLQIVLDIPILRPVAISQKIKDVGSLVEG